MKETRTTTRLFATLHVKKSYKTITCRLVTELFIKQIYKNCNIFLFISLKLVLLHYHPLQKSRGQM